MTGHDTGLARSGRVFVFGDEINTDLVMPNRAFRLPQAEQHTLAFEAIRPGWVSEVRPGDLIVAGQNFGMGSSRPVGAVLRACGIAGIVAESVNGLCLRNCVNVSLPALDCPGVSSLFHDGDIAQVDYTTGLVKNLTQGTELMGKRLPPLLAEIVVAGGIIPMLVSQDLIEAVPYAAAS